LFAQIRDKTGTGEGLKQLAEIAASHGRTEHAARLFGAVHRLRDPTGSAAPHPPDDASLVSLRAAFGRECVDAAWQEGYALPMDQAIELALEKPVA
jgi:hypothetical protein